MATATAPTPAIAIVSERRRSLAWPQVFARAYTLALAKLPASDTTGIKEFAGLVRGVIDELQLHAVPDLDGT